MKLQQFTQIKARCLQNLHLAHQAVLKRVDDLGHLFNLLANDFGKEFLDQVLQLDTGGFLVNDVKHLLANRSDLSVSGVSGLAKLVFSSGREGNDKDTQQITIGSLDVTVGFDQRLHARKKS